MNQSSDLIIDADYSEENGGWELCFRFPATSEWDDVAAYGSIPDHRLCKFVGPILARMLIAEREFKKVPAT